MNEMVTLLNLTLFNFYTWLSVMFCLFVNGMEHHQDKFLCTFKCHWRINILVFLCVSFTLHLKKKSILTFIHG